jgi:hypothetical protein
MVALLPLVVSQFCGSLARLSAMGCVRFAALQSRGASGFRGATTVAARRDN